MSWGTSDESVFHSAVKNRDGDVDAGYLAVFYALLGWGVNNVVILILAYLAMEKAIDVGALVQNTGIALGANATGFGVVVGAVGLFRKGDQEKPTPLAPIAGGAA